MRPVRAALLAASIAAISACAALGATPAATVPIHVDNDLDVPVGVYVDDRWVGTYPAGATAVAPLPADSATPLTVEVRSPSDATLLSLTVTDRGLADAAAGGYANGDRVGLPCGDLAVVVGTLDPGADLAPAPAVEPGPCP